MHVSYSINNQSVELNSSMGWLFLYQEYFGHDILPDLLPILEAILNAIANTVGAIEGDTEEDVIKAVMKPEVIDGVFVDLSAVEMTTVLNIFWCMAKNENKNIPAPIEYFNQWDNFPIDEIAPKLFKQVIKSCISSKNLESLKARVPFLATMLSSEV